MRSVLNGKFIKPEVVTQISLLESQLGLNGGSVDYNINEFLQIAPRLKTHLVMMLNEPLYSCANLSRSSLFVQVLHECCMYAFP